MDHGSGPRHPITSLTNRNKQTAQPVPARPIVLGQVPKLLGVTEAERFGIEVQQPCLLQEDEKWMTPGVKVGLSLPASC